MEVLLAASTDVVKVEDPSKYHHVRIYTTVCPPPRYFTRKVAEGVHSEEALAPWLKITRYCQNVRVIKSASGPPR